MPIYTIENTENGEVFDVMMKISDKEAWLKKNKWAWCAVGKVIMVNPSFFWGIRKLSSEAVIQKSVSDQYFMKVFSEKRFSSICELGCGKGDRLFFLHQQSVADRYVGYDIKIDSNPTLLKD